MISSGSTWVISISASQFQGRNCARLEGFQGDVGIGQPKRALRPHFACLCARGCLSVVCAALRTSTRARRSDALARHSHCCLPCCTTGDTPWCGESWAAAGRGCPPPLQIGRSKSHLPQVGMPQGLAAAREEQLATFDSGGRGKRRRDRVRARAHMLDLASGCLPCAYLGCLAEAWRQYKKPARGFL